MTRTDGILAALQQELERRRPELDAAMGLSTVTMIVGLSRAGKACSVICRTESRLALDNGMLRLVE